MIEAFWRPNSAGHRRNDKLGAAGVFEDAKAVIGPYSAPPVACHAANPRAADIARQIAGLIARHLPSVRVEHVGSTAVPGCGGRGIIDLLLAAPDGELDTIQMLLDRLGFQRQDGEAFLPDCPLRTGTWMENGETFLLHLYVLSDSAAAVDTMRFLRTCLRADPDLAKAYVKTKRKIIAGGVTDADEYCRQKAEFLKIVLG